MLVLTLGVMTSCITEGEDEDASIVRPGDTVPPFSVVLDDGTIFNSQNLGGVWTMLVFFNTSCSDCQRELPRLNEIYNDSITLDAILPTTASGTGRIICIAREENAEDIQLFWSHHSLTMPFSPQSDRTIYNLFARSVIPRIYVISPDGIVHR